MVSHLINELDYPIEILSQDGATPLHFAAHRGDIVMIKFLLELGADIEARDKNYCTPLLRAMGTNQIEAALILMYKGADMFAVETNGNGLVEIAAHRNNVDALRILRLHGFDVLGKNQESSIQIAMNNTAIFSIEYLLQLDIDEDNKNR